MKLSKILKEEGLTASLRPAQLESMDQFLKVDVGSPHPYYYDTRNRAIHTVRHNVVRTVIPAGVRNLTHAEQLTKTLAKASRREAGLDNPPRTKSASIKSPEEQALIVEGIAKKLRVPGAKRSEESPSWKPSVYGGHTKKKVFFTKGPFFVEAQIEMNGSWDDPVLAVYGKSVDGNDLWRILPRSARSKLKKLEEERHGELHEKPARANALILEMLELLNQSAAPLDPDLLVDVARKVKTPAGFTRDEGWGTMADFGSNVYASAKKESYFVDLLSEDVRIIINFTQVQDDGLSAEGHTNFKAPDGSWFSFSRRGIDSSFHLGKWGEPVKKVNQVISEQIKKAKSRISDYKNPVKVVVDGSGFTLTQKRLRHLQDLFKRQGGFTLTPAGFGIGYRITARKPRGRYGVGQAPRELAELFGVSRLYFERFDHD